MSKINSADQLRLTILELEGKQTLERVFLIRQFHHTYESLKPINLVKSTFKEITASEDLKDNLLNTTIGITAGYISQKLFQGVSNNPLRKLLGTALMFGVTNAVSKNPEVVKAAATGLFRIISNLKSKHIEPVG